MRVPLHTIYKLTPIAFGKKIITGKLIISIDCESALRMTFKMIFKRKTFCSKLALNC